MNATRIVPLIAASLLLASTSGLTSASAQEAVSVKTVQPSRETITLSTTQPATVHPYYEAHLGSRVTGYVKSVAVDIGDSVKEGDIIAVIDAPEMIKQYERKMAEVEYLKFKQEQLQAGTAVAEAQAKSDELEFARIDQLARTGSVTSKAKDESESRMASSVAGLAVVKAEVKSAGASVIVAQKETEELKAMMDFATLRAPFAGVVTMRAVDPGDLVKAADSSDSRKPLFRISKLDKLRVRVAVPERDAIRVDAGDAAEFRCRALTGVFAGSVARSSQSIDPQTGSMQVEIDLDNSRGEILPGMFGQVTIRLEEFKDALVLPADAVRFDESGTSATVYVIESGKARLTPVKTGIDDGVRLQILEGLSGDEQVATAMLGRLADGAPAKAIVAEKDAN